MAEIMAGTGTGTVDTLHATLLTGEAGIDLDLDLDLDLDHVRVLVLHVTLGEAMVGIGLGLDPGLDLGPGLLSILHIGADWWWVAHRSRTSKEPLYHEQLDFVDTMWMHHLTRKSGIDDSQIPGFNSL
jgi:hypothetical protein